MPRHTFNHVDLAHALVQELQSVDIAAHIHDSLRPKHLASTLWERETADETPCEQHTAPASLVIVETGTHPVWVLVIISSAYLWQLEHSDHGHEIGLEVDTSAVAELLALCVAGCCSEEPD